MSDLILSPRETQIADLVCKGMTNLEIANELCIEVKTVKNHIGEIFRTNNLRNRVELAMARILVRNRDLGDETEDVA